MPYQRPPLSKAYYSGDINTDKLAIKNPSFYEMTKVGLVLGARADSVDRANKEVVLENGTRVSLYQVSLGNGNACPTFTC